MPESTLQCSLAEMLLFRPHWQLGVIPAHLLAPVAKMEHILSPSLDSACK